MVIIRGIRKNDMNALPQQCVRLNENLRCIGRCNSLDEVAEKISGLCAVQIVRCVSRHDPLAEAVFSSWLWLNRRGEFDLFYGLAEECSKLSQQQPRDSIFVESFQSRKSATPMSRFHQWVDDNEGEFMCCSKYPTHFMRAVPRRYLNGRSAAVPSDWTQFDLKPMDVPRISEVVSEPGFRQTLYRRIRKWISRLEFEDLPDHLTALGLKSAMVEHGSVFFTRYGKERIRTQLAKEVKKALSLRFQNGHVASGT